MKLRILDLIIGAVVLLALILGTLLAHAIDSLLRLTRLAGQGVDIRMETASAATQWAILAAGFVGAMGIIALVMSSYVTAPLRELPTKMRKIGDGAFGERVVLSGYHEIEELAQATNEMTTSLAFRQQQLLHAERLASIGTLVAGVAHEINNPLTFLKGNEELLALDMKDALARGALPAEERAWVDAALGGIETNLKGFAQLAALSASLKVVARAGRQERDDIDVNQLLQGCLVLAHSRFHAGIEVTERLEARHLVRGDAGELSQVVLNLLLNAADAMGDEGHLTVATKDDGDHVVLTVRDTGQGIPPHMQARMFQPFVTTKPKGTGLGLALSRRIVEAHAGELTFETSSSGTAFHVRLRALPAVTGSASSALPAPTRR